MAESNETQVSNLPDYLSGMSQTSELFHEHQGPATWRLLACALLGRQFAKIPTHGVLPRNEVDCLSPGHHPLAQGGTHVWGAIRLLPLGKGARHGKQELKNVLE